MGCIPTKEITAKRKEIHAVLDPLWKSGKFTRNGIYREIARRLGRRTYHTANIRSIEEADEVLKIIASVF